MCLDTRVMQEKHGARVLLEECHDMVLWHHNQLIGFGADFRPNDGL